MFMSTRASASVGGFGSAFDRKSLSSRSTAVAADGDGLIGFNRMQN
jgi:hypothetical protein